MSKGKLLSKRKWKDFRKHEKYLVINSEYPRQLLKRLEILRISMKRIYGINDYY